MKAYKLLSFLLMIFSFSIISCEKENGQEQQVQQVQIDYRAKWAGRYWVPPSGGRFWATIVEGTDSVMHLEDNGHPRLSADMIIHKDGSFRDQCNYPDTIYGWFFAEDSVFFAYPVLGHFGIYYHEYYGVKISDDIPDPQYCK